MAVLANKLVLGPYLEMAKPRIVLMVLITATIGFFLGTSSMAASGVALLIMLVGTGMGAAGAAMLNNYLERDVDVHMMRTRGRALPSGLADPAIALAVGVLLVLGGTALLVAWVNLLSGFLVLLTAFLYVLVYTPLKRVTWWNTPIGAIPGALPPMIGWAAARGELNAGAWVLFAILFAWQHPHFYAIAWMYRDDYREAGFKMLPVVDLSERRVFRQSILFSIALIVFSMLLTRVQVAGTFYLIGAILIGAGMLVTSLEWATSHSRADARRVLLASVIYLPALLALLVIDAGLLAGR